MVAAKALGMWVSASDNNSSWPWTHLVEVPFKWYFLLYSWLMVLYTNTMTETQQWTLEYMLDHGGKGHTGRGGLHTQTMRALERSGFVVKDGARHLQVQSWWQDWRVTILGREVNKR